MLAKPLREPTQFFAALSFLPHLTPEVVQTQLRQRETLLETEIVELSGVLKTMIPKIGRLVLIEVEYARAMRRAELAWVRSFQKELETGRFGWDPAEICRFAGAQPAEAPICSIPKRRRKR